MIYRGYTGHVTYDEEANILHGEVIGIKDVITFQSNSISDIEKEFCKSVDIYLNLCKRKKRKPEKAYSGKFVLRIPPVLHKKIDIQAKEKNLSINNFVMEILERSIL